MITLRKNNYILIVALSLAVTSCKVPMATVTKNNVKEALPEKFDQNVPQDSTKNSGITPWREFFTDPTLVSLIEEALHNNQDLLIALQEIEIAKSNVSAAKGNLLPTVGYSAGVGISKDARYTSAGAGDATTEMEPGKAIPDPLMDYQAGLTFSWDVDIWKKLRTEKKATVVRYLSSIEGKNFVLSSLIAEIASQYYQLLSLDNQLDVTEKYIKLQERALEISKIQKEASVATELAVKQFEAELAKSKASEFDIRQSITETENAINTLLGRYPQTIQRDQQRFLSIVPQSVYAGVPSQLLQNRPDIKQAEYELEASKLDVEAARKEFYPSLNISATLFLDAFKPSYLVKMPESVAYSLAAGLAGPLINKNAIQTQFQQADAKQIEALYEYEKTILQAYMDISNQLSKIKNADEYYKLKMQQCDALDRSIDISTQLFQNSRADYLDVLTSQRDALDAKLELIDAKENQLNAVVNIYKSLGGGWK